MIKVATTVDILKIHKDETMVNIHRLNKVVIMVVCLSNLMIEVVNNQLIIQSLSSHRSHILTRLSHYILIRNPDLVMLSVDADQYTIQPEHIECIRERILMCMT